MNIFKNYKPKNLEDFDFEDDYKNNLKQFINKEFLNIIIIGEDGTGKTTLLNTIIMSYLNTIRNSDAKNNIESNINEPLESTHVFRINNLKDCGITFYRNEVKNFCQFPSKRKKLLVVDNLEMVDKSIQSIFKYYMEKWSNNFYFIATTSNPHKINESLLAKTYQLLLPKKSSLTIKHVLDNICMSEKICITDDAKEYIITQCNGKIKLLFMFLQKVYYLHGKINLRLIEENFTMLSYNDFKAYFEACKESNYQDAFKLIEHFLSKGYSICDIFDEMFHFVKLQENDSNNIFTEEAKYEIIKLISKYTLILNTIHEENVELYFFTNSLIAMLNK